jgi:hypothetical protein
MIYLLRNFATRCSRLFSCAIVLCCFLSVQGQDSSDVRRPSIGLDLSLMGYTSGDEVITPSLQFSTANNLIFRMGPLLLTNRDSKFISGYDFSFGRIHNTQSGKLQSTADIGIQHYTYISDLGNFEEELLFVMGFGENIVLGKSDLKFSISVAIDLQEYQPLGENDFRGMIKISWVFPRIYSFNGRQSKK